MCGLISQRDGLSDDRSTEHDFGASTNPLSVVLIGPYPRDPQRIRGGVQASVYGLARALSACPNVMRVTVVAVPESKEDAGVRYSLVHGGVEVIYLSRPFRFQASGVLHAFRVARVIAAQCATITHVHGTGLLQFAVLGLLRLRRSAAVWTLHGITEKEMLQRYEEDHSLGALSRYWFYRLLERASLRIVRAVIVDTAYVARQVQHRTTALSIIPQGIVNEELAVGSLARDEEPLLLSVGVISPRKGHARTLEAFAMVLRIVPTARLVIAGAAPDSEYYEFLQAELKRLSLNKSVEIRVGVAKQELISLYRRAWLFVLHSQEESQGIAICEALAAGLPVIATKAGGIPDVVSDGETGILVSYGSVSSFADAIISLLVSPERLAAMAARAKGAGRGFMWNQLAERVLQIYRTVIRDTDERRCALPERASQE
jgi:glycosyltransferase involved in cell wall biosynthesis